MKIALDKNGHNNAEKKKLFKKASDQNLKVNGHSSNVSPYAPMANEVATTESVNDTENGQLLTSRMSKLTT